MKTKEEIIFWDTEDTEVLRYDCLEEATGMILDGYHPDPIPRTLDIWSWKRKDLTGHTDEYADDVADRLLEFLDENYGYEDPLTNASELKPFALEFVRKSLEVYVPWQCEKVEKFTIDTVEWVKENAPEWIKEGVRFENEMA